MAERTPYDRHADLGHPPLVREAIGAATIAPPDIIEECPACGQRWIWQPGAEYPLTLRPR